MNTHTKAITSLTALLLVGLTVTCRADTATSRDHYRTQLDVNSCVAEIKKRADYDDASRVVHFVRELEQKNLVEAKVTVDTTVYVNGDTRHYSTSCVVAQLGKVVDIQFEAVAGSQLVSANR